MRISDWSSDVCSSDLDGFAGASILITGAASGIGAATATLLAGRGVRKLILADRDEARLADFAFSLPCERQLVIGAVADERMWSDADLTGLTPSVRSEERRVGKEGVSTGRYSGC